MIIAERKPFNEIKQMVAPYKNILVLGCGTCVAICWAGGEKEVAILAAELRLAFAKDGKSIREGNIQRQCEPEMVLAMKESIEKADVILSLACGVGAQTVAQIYDTIPVVPGLNTTFMGMPVKEGQWVEMCEGCGDCLLSRTGGICATNRCSKGLQNGPCGGMRKGGKCELDPNKDCAWALIYRLLEKQGRLDLMQKYNPPKNFRAVKRPGKIQSESM